ncbi:tryptophan synthase subunit alpha [Aristophania vespae]|uniref:tryptophan synthase subunit alpha n=1 Tax=Aristophania vespae TaxID=2697033 RepID=UPI0023517AEB|nr:tryptophan synthase subunit alpha [Aristophania vespae]UMM63780.1 Tryptophan synthase alpha chain [Aristophania vespae]
MSRISACFAALKAQGRGALIPYLEAFDPDYETSKKLLAEMAQNGGDIIEIGVPFSDPAADGPTIQLAAKRALKAGATLSRILDMVADFRRTNDNTPLILMGYLNPIEQFGTERFLEEAAKAGVDGLIIVDLPFEEAKDVRASAKSKGLDLIHLTTPNTPEDRLELTLKEASGFIYYVSITGITGTNSATEEQLRQSMGRLRKVTNLPVITGFGIATPEQARSASHISDGAVVASALIKEMAGTLEDGKATSKTIPTVIQSLKKLAEAVRS